jgi:hypothetical protein
MCFDHPNQDGSGGDDKNAGLGQQALFPVGQMDGDWTKAKLPCGRRKSSETIGEDFIRSEPCAGKTHDLSSRMEENN